MTRWKTQWLATAAALMLGLSANLAQAQPDHRRGPAGHAQAHGKIHPHARPHAHPKASPRIQPKAPPRAHPHVRHDLRRPGPGGPPHAHGGRHGAGPHHNWVRGSRIPPQFRSRHYVVNDWRGHRLSRPPQGHHWVQYGSDYLLVAIASGVIAQLILSH